MISEEKLEVLKHYNVGLQAYKEQRWDDGIAAFKKALEYDENDGPSKLYLERCEHFKANPPGEDWDGVFTMTTK